MAAADTEPMDVETAASSTSTALEADTQLVEFRLSRVITQAHTNDIRALDRAPTSSVGIISGSRDGSVKMWIERAGSLAMTLELKQLNNEQHSVAVSSLAVYETPEGDKLIIIGRRDGVITVYNGATQVATLHEHQQNVCCLHVDSAAKVLLSGSWDHKAIVWPLDQIGSHGFNAHVTVLDGHSHSVWAVATLPGRPNLYLTASADKTIKLWEDDKQLKTFTGHKDVVRSLLVLSDTRFISAANDGTLKLWNADNGACVKTYDSQAKEYIYSLTKTTLKNGLEFVLSSGENGSFEIWHLHEDASLTFQQSLRTPATSNWALATLQNSDIAMATDTGNIYVFTTAPERFASNDVLETYDSSVAAIIATLVAQKEAQESDTVTIKVALDDGAPQLELKYTKGSDPTDAAEKFIRDNSLPMSYLNEIVEYIKQNIPEARAAAASKMKRQPTQRRLFEGEYWDYVFEVKTDDGKELAVTYNVGEDPSYAAQRFVEKYNLTMKFLPQIENMLREQVPELSGNVVSSNFADPFTGGGRYVPGSNGAAANGSFADPFTGGGRYVPGQSAGPTSAPTGGDPLTSGGRYIPGSAGTGLVPNSSLSIDKKRPRSDLVPLNTFIAFGLESASEKALIKLREMNDAQIEYQLPLEQLEEMDKIMKPDAYDISDYQVMALESGLRWSMETIVPALDIFRVALLREEFNQIFCSFDPVNGLPGKGRCTLQRLIDLLISDPPLPVRILVCRAFANAAAHEWGRQMIQRDISTNVPVILNQLNVPKPAVQLAAASAIANLALVLLKQTEAGQIAELGPREDALRAIIKTTESVASFSEYAPAALLRLLQAVVTIMWGDSTVIKLGKDRGIATIVNRIKDAVSEESAKNVARDIVEMTFAV